MSSCVARGLLFTTALIISLGPASEVHGQFDTVINVPPDRFDGTLESNCQLNLFAGADVQSLTAGPGTNIEVNLLGWNYDYFVTFHAGTTANLNDGFVNEVCVHEGAELFVQGGRFFRLFCDGTAYLNTQVNEGLVRVGETAVVEFIGGDVRTDIDIDGIASFANGTFGDLTVDVSETGKLVVNEDGFGAADFNFSIRGEVELLGGGIGGDFLTVGPTGVVYQNGGNLSGSDLSIQGYVRTFAGRISSSLTRVLGVVDFYGGEFNFTFQRLEIENALNVYGGDFNPPSEFQLQVRSDGDLNLYGSEFAIDGVLIKGLESGVPFTVKDRGIELSGIYADGSSFSMPLDFNDSGNINVTQLILGDTNRDNSINLLDVSSFLDALGGEEYLAEADTNLDREINMADVGVFVDLLLGQTN